MTTADHRVQTAPTCAIAVMAKASAPGRTKTRMAPPLTHEEAAALNTSFLQDIAQNIADASDAAPIRAYVAFGPPGSEPFFHEHMPEVSLLECWLGDFGDCLFFAVEALLARGHAGACVLNSDSPTLPPAILADLARALLAPGDRAVIGPAEDGGYYVLGLKTAHRRLFDDIAWSTDKVFEQTLERAAEIGLAVHVLPTWYDVDDAASLRRLHKDIFEPALDPTERLAPSAAGHTRRLFVRMTEDSGLMARLFDATATAE